jgi:hypothetical protein
MYTFFWKISKKKLAFNPALYPRLLFSKNTKSFVCGNDQLLSVNVLKHFDTSLFTGVTSVPGTAVIVDDKTLMEKGSK